jgi:hypothetical protein
MIVVNNILHYLKGTQDYGMFYSIGGEDYLTSFVNVIIVMIMTQ